MDPITTIQLHSNPHNPVHAAPAATAARRQQRLASLLAPLKAAATVDAEGGGALSGDGPTATLKNDGAYSPNERRKINLSGLTD